MLIFLNVQANFIVKDSKSSSMAMSIALLNTYRAIQGKSQVAGLSGTGILRVDGSFDNSNCETKKHQAAIMGVDYLNYFVTARECNHLYDLEQLMNQVQ